MHLVQIGRALLVLLTARAEPEIGALVRIGGWRKAAMLTPGLIKDTLVHRFRNFATFGLVPATGRKSGPVRGTGPPRVFRLLATVNVHIKRPPSPKHALPNSKLYLWGVLHHIPPSLKSIYIP
jgi:hypothetical protein